MLLSAPVGAGMLQLYSGKNVCRNNLWRQIEHEQYLNQADNKIPVKALLSWAMDVNSRSVGKNRWGNYYFHNFKIEDKNKILGIFSPKGLITSILDWMKRYVKCCINSKWKLRCYSEVFLTTLFINVLFSRFDPAQWGAYGEHYNPSQFVWIFSWKITADDFLLIFQ